MCVLLNQMMQDKTIIVYGTGQIFRQYEQVIVWDNVVSIVDKNARQEKMMIHGKRVCYPGQIVALEYDYIVVFSDRYFEEVKTDLSGNFFVDEQKIVSWRVFFHESESVSDEMAKLYSEFVEDTGVISILDIGKQKLARCFYTNKWPQIEVSNFGLCRFKLYQTFYKSIFNSVPSKKYDVVFLWETFEKDIEWDCLMAMSGRFMIWTVSYSYSIQEDFMIQLQRLERWGRKSVFRFSQGIVCIFDKNKEEKRIECNIFVVSHKRYNVLSDFIYKPVCVGNYIQDGFYTEQSGMNIRHLNDRINECTALYWIWKNTNSEYVGLNHYRRYFYNSGIRNSANYLSGNKIVKIFGSGFDIILPVLTRLNVTVLESIRNSVGERLCDEAVRILSGVFRSNKLSERKGLEHVLSGYTFYKCNMFVTKRSVFNSYCQWLFSFLIQAAEKLDVSECDIHHKRTMGFFAEIMLTVWLLEQNIKIKELPVSEI